VSPSLKELDSSLPLSTVSTVWWVPVPFTASGLMAGLPGFASHGGILHLGNGCY